MLREEKVEPKKIYLKLSVTCATYSSRDARLFAFHFCATFNEHLYLFSFLRNYFQLKLLKIMKTHECYRNQRLEVNIKPKVKRVTALTVSVKV